MSDANKNPSRKSIRLSGYNYSEYGYYFVTICANGRRLLFGSIREGKMYLNKLGQIIRECWNEIPEHYPIVELDKYIIMPNHIHGIIIIRNPIVGAQNLAPGIPIRAEDFRSLPEDTCQHIIPKTLGSIIRGFKIGVTKYARLKNQNITIWQRNYYEHIIRNQKDYQNIWNYIDLNPDKWEWDKNNPKNF